MNQYVTGAVIRKLREQKSMTQAELADLLTETVLNRYRTLKKREAPAGTLRT